MNDHLKRHTLDALILIGNISKTAGPYTPELSSYQWHDTLRRHLSLTSKEIDVVSMELCRAGLVEKHKNNDRIYARLTEMGEEAYKNFKGYPAPSFKDELLGAIKKYVPFWRNGHA